MALIELTADVQVRAKYTLLFILYYRGFITLIELTADV